MAGKLPKSERESREKFILDRLRLGISRAEIQRQFGAKFSLCPRVCANWVVDVSNSLVLLDPEERDRVRAAMLEVLHSQLVGVQDDIFKLSSEISKIEAARENRDVIVNRLIGCEDAKLRRHLKQEIKLLPKYAWNAYVYSIEARSRLREKAIKICVEIGTLRGLYLQKLPIVRAIEILSSSQIVDTRTARNLIEIINNFEKGLDSISQVDSHVAN